MKKFFCILFFIVSINLCAQETGYFANAVSSLVPPSPTVAALAKYVEVPIDYYTGLPKIEVPIYTLKDNDLEIPIYLSYNAGGHRVAETPSWVGLGWSLHSGGVITRIIQGEDDLFSPYGYIYRGANITPAMERDPVYNDASSQNYWNTLLTKENDPEPDIFYFNFGSFTGQFVIAPGVKPIVFSKQKIKVECVFSENATFHRKMLTTFIITDNRGIKYTFSDIEYQSTTTYGTYTGVGSYEVIPPIAPVTGYNTNTKNFTYQVGSIPKTSVSAWYLSSIETPNGCKATFKYADEISLDYKNGTFFYGKVAGGSYDGKEWVEGFGNYIENHSKRLSSIDWSSGNIIFEADEIRKDLTAPTALNSTPAKLLTGIKVYNNNVIIKNLSFIHSYRKREEDNYKNYIELRLQLDKVREISTTNTKEYLEYAFDYNQGTLPHRDSYSVDLWGYTNWGGASFKPNLYKYASISQLYPSEYCILPKHGNEIPLYKTSDGGDKEPRLDYTKYGVLNKIVYPTGGYSIFSYELNNFSLDGNNFFAGGLRIKSIETTERDNLAPLIRFFEYTDPSTGLSSGKIVNLPTFGDKMVAINGDDFKGDPARYSISKSELQGTRGSYVGYQNVTEILVNAQGDTLGKTIRNYSFPGSYGVTEEDCNGSDCGFKVLPVKYFSFSRNYQELSIDDYKHWGLAFPKVPNYDWNRGYIEKEVVKDRFNKTVKEVCYTYNTLDDWHIEKVPGIVFRPFTGQDIGWTFAYSRYYLTSGWRYLAESKVTNYTDGGQPIVTTEKYYYENFAHMQPTKVEKSNSDNVITTKKMYYCLDSPTSISTSADVLLYMNEHHIISPVLKEEYFKGEKQVDGTIVNFSLNPPTKSVLVCNSVEKYIGDKYQNQLFFDGYDAHGRLLQYHKEGDVNNSVIWGYNSQYPTARVVNASINQIAYAGFEDVTIVNSTAYNLGNWQIDAGLSWASYSDVKTGMSCIGTPSNNAPIRSKMVIPSGKYIVSFYGKRLNNNSDGKIAITGFSSYNPLFGDEWRFVSAEITLTSSQVLEILLTNAKIDELKLFPVGSQITTYTWKSGIGITSETDVNGITKYYDYDGFGRLIKVKDGDGFLLKNYDYHLGQQ